MLAGDAGDLTVAIAALSRRLGDQTDRSLPKFSGYRRWNELVALLSCAMTPSTSKQ